MVGRIVPAGPGGLMTTLAGNDAAPSHRWLRLFLVLVAALEFLDALSGVQNIFTDYHHETTMLRFAQALSINLAGAIARGGPALIFAALGNIRYAILALAAMTLATWVLDSLPSIALRGVTLGLDIGTLAELFLYVIAPVAAVAASLLALKDKRLALATLLAGLPALAKWLGFVAFFIAIMIYGF